LEIGNGEKLSAPRMDAKIRDEAEVRQAAIAG
jgi:hypothetical protein